MASPAPAVPTPRTVVVLARAPVAGAAKTRLSPPLTPAGAAFLAGAFLEDTLALCRQVASTQVVLACCPPNAVPRLRPLAPGLATAVVPQVEGDLGARIEAVVRGYAAPGSAVVVVGSDAPDLPTACIEGAFHLVEADTADLVLGPAADGGFTLLAARALPPGLLRGIPWSTSQTLAAVLHRAGAAGLRTAGVEPWEDVDTVEDLRRLATRLRGAPPGTAPRTRRALATLQGVPGLLAVLPR